MSTEAVFYEQDCLVGNTRKGLSLIKAVVREQEAFSPRLEDLTDEQLRKIAAMRTAQELTAEMDRRVKIERVNYQAEKARYIAQASRTGSLRTKDLYSKALARMEAWCQREGISPLELTTARADDWIESEKASGRAPATVRLDVSGVSAFWTWLERRHSELRNPFRGTRARPSRKAARKLAVPNDDEVRTLEASAAPWLKAAIVLMGQGGLRVGGLTGLSVNGTRWTTVTKGKEQTGEVPQEAREAIHRAGLPLRSPFADFTTARISKAFEYQAQKLVEAGRIRARYSVHDLRHAFAVRFYRQRTTSTQHRRRSAMLG